MSEGWSFDGKTSCANSGCAPTTEPSNVLNHPKGSRSSGKSGVLGSSGGGSFGCETKSTPTVKSWPPRSGRAGVITSSSPGSSQVAGRPSTVTAPIESPSKSRLKRESDFVASARIVTFP